MPANHRGDEAVPNPDCLLENSIVDLRCGEHIPFRRGCAPGCIRLAHIFRARRASSRLRFYRDWARIMAATAAATTVQSSLLERRGRFNLRILIEVFVVLAAYSFGRLHQWVRDARGVLRSGRDGR
jgi:hypothetical protein